MKKLLSFLGIIGLVATSTLTVVACGNERDYTKDNEGEETGEGPGEGEGSGEGTGEGGESGNGNENTESAIEKVAKYKDLLDKVWIDTFEDELSQSKIMTKIEKDLSGDLEGTKIFNFGYLTKNYPIPTEQGSIKIDFSHNDQAKQKMKNDLQIIFHDETFSGYFTEMIKKNYDKYRDIAIGMAWKDTYGGFEIGNEFNLVGQYITPKPNATKELIYTLSLSPILKMYYRDESGNKDIYKTTPFEINLLIGENGNVMQMVDAVKDKLPSQLLNNNQEPGATQFEYNDFKNSTKYVKNYGNVKKPIVNFVNDSKQSIFKNNLVKTIDEILKAQVETGVNVEIDPGDLINQKNVSVSGDWLKTEEDWSQTKSLTHFQNNSLVNNLILKNKNDPGMNEETAIRLIESRLFTSRVIKSETYDEKLNKFLNKYIQDKKVKKQIVHEVHAHGNFKLSNLQIVFNTQNNNVKLKIPTIIVPWTYKNNESSQLKSKKEEFLSALYQSILFANQHLWNVNKNPVVFQTMFNMDWQAKTDYQKALQKATNTSWEDITNKLNNGGKIAINQGMHFQVGTGASGNSEMNGSAIGDLMTTSTAMKFESFTSSIKVGTDRDLVVKKGSNGKFGVGLNGGDNFQWAKLDYNLSFGDIQIKARFPWFNPNYNGPETTGEIIEELNDGFYGRWPLDKDWGYFRDATHKPDWLLFELN
ncbi:lipoprotein [Williamsoniiplasma lucivorax]|uniref:Lipoprotein n=1 Tax=Williamsoniiplasma lucivorax TaxID=209274 RepID=A0A2S5RET0_9MOLU|nr:lipoprotein [Williamsoniiplasma lucivorax]PPE05722.1 hypothetical protein ELUCI_v1c00080 [Williamsoniiplasma lucivorax]